MEVQFTELAFAENSAARILRGLRDGHVGWGELLARAQQAIGIFQEFPLQRARELLTEQNALSLIAAARILDTASYPAAGLSEEGRSNLNCVAAIAFAMYGNFASAKAAAQRALPVPSPHIAALLATAAPSLAGQLFLDAAKDEVTGTYVEQLIGYLHTGDAGKTPALREAFIKCLLHASEAFESSLYRSARLCLEHVILLSVASVLKTCCPELSAKYVTTLIDSGVVTFLPPQFKAITQHEIVTSPGNSIVALPTSTGKTLIGELCLVNSLSVEDGIACYLAPYVALGGQVADAIERHTPSEYRVHREIGGFQTSKTFLTGFVSKEIIVATPERLDSLLRNSPDLIKHLRCIICDEAHLIENDSRGVRMEGLVTRLKLLQDRNVRARIVLLSAVLSEYESIQRWLKVPAEQVVVDSWRPTARRLAFWRQSGRLQWYFASDPIRTPGTTSTTMLGERILPWPQPRLTAGGEFGRVRFQEPRVHENVAFLVDFLWKTFNGQILCVCATKEHTRKLASALAIRFSPLEPLPQSIVRAVDRIRARYKFLLPLSELMKNGVAYHNSTVPKDLRHLIEAGVRDGALKAVASTTTLAEGVDLPFRFTVIADWLAWQGAKQAPMPSLLFRNVAGRCGRAGVFTEGDTIIFDNPLGDANYTHPSVRENVQAQAFLSSRSAELKSALRDLPVYSPHDARWAALASQFLAAIPENANANNLADTFAQSTLWGSNTPDGPPATRALRRIRVELLKGGSASGFAVEASPIALTSLGIAANSTGFSPESCRQIVSYLQSSDESAKAPHQIAARLLKQFSQLPEQPNTNLRKMLNQKRHRFPVLEEDLEEVISAWLNNIPREQSFAALPRVRRSARRPRVEAWLEGSTEAANWDEDFDKYVDFVSSVIEGFLPWLLRTCSRLSEFGSSGARELPWVELASLFEPTAVIDESEMGEQEPV
jgi:helicase